MQRMPAVSRPAWMLALSGIADRSGAARRSPVEIIATMGSYVTRTQAAEMSGLHAGPFGRWADGVTAMREDCAAFARHWQAHNDRVLGLDGQPDGTGRVRGLVAHRSLIPHRLYLTGRGSRPAGDHRYTDWCYGPARTSKC